MLVSLTELMKDANEKGYAVGAFNATNLESLIAIIEAAEETGKGVILNHAEVHSSLIAIEDIGPIMVEYAKKATVPVCVHLDHGTSLESCMNAIRLGFTSVMLDASGEDYEANVRDTALICRLAHSIGVTVEAELGHIFSSDIGVGEGAVQETLDSYGNAEDVYTDPDMAKDFVERTGVDALAIAVGNAHGAYKLPPKLDFERIRTIANTIDVPLVLHGGSGLTDNDFRQAIKEGISKVNIFTDINVAAVEAEFRKFSDMNKGIIDLIPAAVEAVKKLSSDVGIPADLKGILKEEDIDFLAQSAMDDACRPGNPKDPTKEDIIAIYKSLL